MNTIIMMRTDLCKIGKVDESVFQVLRLKTELLHGKSEESNPWVKMQELSHTPIPHI